VSGVLRVERDGGVARVTLARPEVRNAFNAELIAELAWTFEAFRKDPRSKGSGLGLAIVRRVAEAHGGAAGVENLPGRGATFWIRVPQ